MQKEQENKQDYTEPISDLTESIEQAQTDPSEPAASDVTADKLDQMFERWMGLIEQRFRHAEERGFREGMAAADRAAKKAESERTVPNFLSDIRRDIWDS